MKGPQVKGRLLQRWRQKTSVVFYVCQEHRRGSGRKDIERPSLSTWVVRKGVNPPVCPNTAGTQPLKLLCFLLSLCLFGDKMDIIRLLISLCFWSAEKGATYHFVCGQMMGVGDLHNCRAAPAISLLPLFPFERCAISHPWSHTRAWDPAQNWVLYFIYIYILYISLSSLP